MCVCVCVCVRACVCVCMHTHVYLHVCLHTIYMLSCVVESSSWWSHVSICCNVYSQLLSEETIIENQIPFLVDLGKFDNALDLATISGDPQLSEWGQGSKVIVRFWAKMGTIIINFVFLWLLSCALVLMLFVKMLYNLLLAHACMCGCCLLLFVYI